MYPTVPPPPEEETYWSVGDLELFKGASAFYLDGSGGSRSSDTRLRRCCWGAVVVDFTGCEAPEVVAGCLGALAGADQSVPRSELQAAVCVAELTGPNEVGLMSDCKYVVDKASISRARSRYGANGDLWERYWSAYDSKSGKIRIVKVKAHCTHADVLNGAISWQDYAGNAYADAYADAAAEKASLPSASSRALTSWTRPL